MAQGPLGSLLGDIRRLYEDGAVGLQSDAQLLERFRSLGDRSAFEVLVGRHGRMVLSVCREVLGDPDDAEDAFQATFLLLARKAGRLRVERTLAGWLHRVGYRIAVQAGIAAARRRRHEGRAAALAADACGPPADAVAEAAEGRRVLHAELDRLPDRLRIPVVLYYLEGRSYAEAASLIGVPEATVRGRLARARERLRDRLTRCGLAPAEASSRLLPPLAPALPPLPPGLVSATARAASCLTLAPAATADGMAASIVLMQQFLGTLIVSKLKVAAAGIATILALAWMTASLAAPTAQGEPPRPTKAHAAGHPSAEAQPNAGAIVHYAGRVLGVDDRPIAGATILVGYSIDGKGKPVELGAVGAGRGQTRVTVERARFFLERARTDAAGHFQFDVDMSHLVKDREDLGIQNIHLYAQAEGYGPVSLPAWPPQARDRFEFRLPWDDVPIEGRILDAQGRPAGGAGIQPVALYYKQDDDGWPRDWSDPGSLRSLEDSMGDTGCDDGMALIPAVKADAEGRFRLTGLGRERTVVLRISHPGSSPEQIEVMTRPGRSDRPLNVQAGFDGRPILRYDRATFVHQLPATEPRIRTVFVWVRPRGDRAESLRITEWLTKQISQGTTLKVVGTPEGADLILQGTINRPRDEPASPPAGPRP
jgi:RNA polymerase sigma factor (sigma-70 family)